MAVEIINDSVKFQAGTKLLELATEVAESGRLTRPEVVANIDKGFKISAWLQALNFDQFLTQTQVSQIINCLIKTANLNDFPAAPTINIPLTDVIIGSGNTVNVTNNFDAGTPAINTDVDIGTEVVDSFAVSSARGVLYHWRITSLDGLTQREGLLHGSWLADGTLEYTNEAHPTIGGTVQVTLSLDFDSGDIRLLATATSNNWTVSCIRYLVP